MGARSLVASGLRAVLKAVEGAYRPGPYFLPYSGGFLPAGTVTNFWQLGQNVQPLASTSAMVEACVSAYAQTTAMLPGYHYRKNEKGGKDKVDTSSLSRVLKQPNEYQTISDFMLNATRMLYLDGNAFALALRNDRYEIDELHLMDSMLSFPQLAANGEVFYKLAGNSIIDRRIEGPLIVPQRDVLHVRLHVDRTRRYPFPLWGLSPIWAAINDIGVSEAISAQQLQFYQNQARPSAVLQTDLVLDQPTVQDLRERWDEQTKGINQGRTPILTAGLKVQPWATVGKDAQIAEMLKLSDEKIALVFRIPMQILGLGEKPGSSTEALMQFWISTGLGFCLKHIELAYNKLFNLDGGDDEFVEFDTSALLRSTFKERLEALNVAVRGGIYAPNEAREFEGLDSAGPAGDEPRVQQQVVPLSAAEAITKPTRPGASPYPPPAPGPEGAPPAPKQPAAPLPKADPDAVKRALRGINRAAARAARHLS
jgi:HK97 family phage portal protein